MPAKDHLKDLQGAWCFSTNWEILICSLKLNLDPQWLILTEKAFLFFILGGKTPTDSLLSSMHSWFNLQEMFNNSRLMALYRSVFEKIGELVEFNPLSVMIDMEQAVVTDLNGMFSECSVMFCFTTTFNKQLMNTRKMETWKHSLAILSQTSLAGWEKMDQEVVRGTQIQCIISKTMR